MKKRTLYIIIIIVLLAFVAFITSIETIYESPNNMLKIREINTGFSILSAMPGTGGNHNNYIMIINKTGLPIRKFHSSTYGSHYNLEEVLCDKDSSIIFIEGKDDGRWIIRIVVDNYRVISEQTTSFEIANREIEAFYKQKLKGTWINKTDTILISNKIVLNGKEYPFEIYNKKNLSRYYGENAGNIIRPELYPLTEKEIPIKDFAKNLTVTSDNRFILTRSLDNSDLVFNRIK